MVALGRPGAAVALFLLCVPAQLSAQIVSESVDVGVFGRIREEGLNRSQVLATARHLTDVIGPRLTGSPRLQAAHEWTAARMNEWNIDDVATDPWGRFGRGWENVRYYGRVLSPFNQQLHAAPVAWTGSTPGPVRASALLVEAASVEDLRARYAGQLGGRFIIQPQPPLILDGDTLRPPGSTDAPSQSQEGVPAFWRLPLDSLVGPRVVDRTLFVADSVRGVERRREIMAQRRPQIAVARALEEMVAAEHAAGILTASGYAYGLIEHFGRETWSPGRQDSTVMVAVAPEEYANIARNLRAGVPVEIELDVENRFLTDDLDAYNTFGQIRGSERPDEYVVIGAHLDSWHAGTGATDNAAGVAVVMEAMRILRALDLQPRRTIRVALWSGEEQGLLGSSAWLENNPALHSRISTYLNVDYGTGRIRGIDIGTYAQAAGIFEQVLWPFRDLGVIGVRNASLFGSDHDSFNGVGIPGFSFIQDPLDYWDRTHHLSADTFDRLVEDNLKQAAVVLAATAYHLAMREEPMPQE